MYKVVVLIVVLFGLVAPVRAQDDVVVKGWLSIPSIWDYAKPIVEDNWDLSDLGNGVAHLDTTNWIGIDYGRVVIAGHNPGAFSLIGNITAGDLIALWDSEHYAIYKVVAVHKGVDPSEERWTYSTYEPTLVLVSCWDNEQSRIVIEAVRV